jgi:DDE superfamily endonuclease
LPHCNPYPGLRGVIVLDNASTHTNPRVVQLIGDYGCLVKAPPPYSPDLSPVELTFSMLKAGCRRHWPQHRDDFDDDFDTDFGGLLAFAIAISGCDEKEERHFRHAGGGYIFEGDGGEIQSRSRGLGEGTNCLRMNSGT